MQPQEILDRLSAHGIDPADYIRIKNLVSFSFPQARVVFVRQFGRRSIARVLRQIEETREFLEKDFILSPEQKGEIGKSVSKAELLAWNALLEANGPKIGPWSLSSVIVATGKEANRQPVYFRSALKLTAIHSETKKKRAVVIPGNEANDPVRLPSAWMRAVEKLGIWDLVYKGSVHRRIVSGRNPRGWPVFTQVLIPQLYQYLYPYYAKRGHYSGRRASLATGNAFFPKDLMEDMLHILRFEYPDTFAATTIAQLNAVVQRCLQANPKLLNPQKLPKSAR